MAEQAYADYAILTNQNYMILVGAAANENGLTAAQDQVIASSEAALYESLKFINGVQAEAPGC